uniref:Uncharacterized protein n=1 Tax=Parascaris equorum TaxID=6256 RepID=A0A914RBN3_PAREQ
MFAEASSDDHVVMALLNSGIGEVIVNVAATPSEHDFHLSLLHIVALIVKHRVGAEEVLRQCPPEVLQSACSRVQRRRMLVAATLGKEGFHHVQTQLDHHLDMAYAERREGRMHGLRAQYALCAYKELLYTSV